MSSMIDALVDAQAKAAGWPKPEREYRFAAPRRWRVDYYWPTWVCQGTEATFSYLKRHEPLAVEIEGGVFSRGRHVRPTGFLKDCEKYNTMAAMGIRLIRLTPQQVKAGELQKWLEMMK